MIELVFIACLKSSPDVCEERVLSYLAGAGASACMMQAQPELAQWALTHPDYTIVRWRCQAPEARGIDA